MVLVEGATYATAEQLREQGLLSSLWSYTASFYMSPGPLPLLPLGGKGNHMATEVEDGARPGACPWTWSMAVKLVLPCSKATSQRTISLARRALRRAPR